MKHEYEQAKEQCQHAAQIAKGGAFGKFFNHVSVTGGIYKNANWNDANKQPYNLAYGVNCCQYSFLSVSFGNN